LDDEIWQQILSLESRDQTQKWFEKIHSRQANARRIKEINAAAKQAREFFRNASSSNYSVRPLLTFYGVSCLSRALLLLLRKSGGEETLTAGHGLETVKWGSLLSGEPSDGLACLCDLKIRTCAGLFSEFAEGTKSRTSMHISSSEVDWRLFYGTPDRGAEITLGELFERIPDLQKDYSNICKNLKYSRINEMTFDFETGFKAKVSSDFFLNFRSVYADLGYNIECHDQWCDISCDANTFTQNGPLFIHSYIHKTFGAIPSLFVAAPFPGNRLYSQLCITYMVGYILGMLSRYYPTHWMSLIQGDKGDAMWPTINRAQQCVELSYPELVIELIHDILKQCDRRRQIQSDAQKNNDSDNEK